ncbi:MAG: hypothetical protein AB1342_17105 [Pseudomonadota bacterium]
MANNKELEAGLKAMAEDFHLPGGGRKKLSRLVAEHMDWFDAAERRGMGWRDMIRVLTAAGVNGRGGKPLSVGTLSSTVWRKRAETADVMCRVDRQARLAAPEPIPESQRVRSRKASPEQRGRPKAAAGKPASPPAFVSPPAKAPERGQADRMPNASRSIHEKLARVAKLRGG